MRFGSVPLLVLCLFCACAWPSQVFRTSYKGRSYEGWESCTHDTWNSTKWCDVVVVERSGCTTREVGRTRYERLDSCCCEPGFEQDPQGLVFAVREFVSEPSCTGKLIDRVRTVSNGAGGHVEGAR
jgi:hypothetical protein